MPNKKHLIHKGEVNQPLGYSWICKNNQYVTKATLNRYDVTAAMFLARYVRFRRLYFCPQLGLSDTVLIVLQPYR